MNDHSAVVDRPLRILFVCLGNICRSPTAHGVFETMVRKAGLSDRIEVRSGGTGGWHVGAPPDPRAQLHARRRGYELGHLRARQVGPADVAESDLVLAMDRTNLVVLEAMADAAHRKKVRLFLTFAPDQPLREVPDPYYGGERGFDQVLDLVEAASRGLLVHARRRIGLP